MKREIKFRAYITNQKTMFYQGDEIDENRKAFWQRWETTSHVSDPMQFTGLRDKNGKEIYEGDILDILFGNPKNVRPDSGDTQGAQYLHHNVEVYWDANRLMWSVQGGNLLPSWDSNSLTGYAYPTYEVVGNIFENPELIKQQHEK